MIVGTICAGVLGQNAAGAAAPGSGAFRGRIVTEWLGDGRRMKLLTPLEYVASDGRSWPVPRGTIIDGASIPSVFWSIIGGPFEGLYRGPSVIHDYYCDTRTRKRADVHHVFYDAMLTAGVGRKKAWLMYQAVDRFGPSWEGPTVDPRCEVGAEDFDFQRCARNAARPALKTVPSDKARLAEFAREMEGQADAADLARLRQAIEAAR